MFPAERAPQIFGGTVFETYPFLLPNLTYVPLPVELRGMEFHVHVFKKLKLQQRS